MMKYLKASTFLFFMNANAPHDDGEIKKESERDMEMFAYN